MSNNLIPENFLRVLKSVKPKRPKTVIDHIINHGFITTEELKDLYGYNHPPRAVRDVRELGIPIDTFKAVDSQGRKIAAYKFGDFENYQPKKSSGRIGISKKIKEHLLQKYGSICFIYREQLDIKVLQVDHRIPFEVSGEAFSDAYDSFMLLSPSANRSKSWACENCDNWKLQKDYAICQKCYWAYPEDYSHIALINMRRLDVLWHGEKEVLEFQKFKYLSNKFNTNEILIIKQLVLSWVNSQDEKL